MKFFDNKYWNIINFSFSILTIWILNKLIGFNDVRSSYELTINLSRQIVIFSGFNLISGNLIYFVDNNKTSVNIFRQLYLLNIIIVFVLTIITSVFIIVLDLFSEEIVYSVLLINIILSFDFLGFFSVAVGKIYVQYFSQFILKLANITSIFLIGYYNFHFSILIFTYLLSLIYILYISSKIGLSPIRIQSIKTLYVTIKRLLFFSLPWFIASPILNYFSTYIWLNLDKNNSQSLVYYSLLLFGSSSLSLLFINPAIDKLTYNIRSKLSTTKLELYLSVLTFILIGVSIILKMNFVIYNNIYHYVMTKILYFDSIFISKYVFYIPLYVAFSCPLLLFTRILHIKEKQKSFAIISVIVSFFQLCVISIYDYLDIIDFINISLCTTFITFICLSPYIINAISKKYLFLFTIMYMLGFLILF